MKNLYIIGGTMGVGKTSVCQALKQNLKNSVFLDGDSCWDASPFQITEETKEMVLDNICYLLNNFLRCSAYENVVFCWVMHEQAIIDHILSRLDLSDCNVKSISLVCNEANLKARLMSEIVNGIREREIIEKSLQRMALYSELNTVKIDSSNKRIDEVVSAILKV